MRRFDQCGVRGLRRDHWRLANKALMRKEIDRCQKAVDLGGLCGNVAE
jgi:hypothetical protein